MLTYLLRILKSLSQHIMLFFNRKHYLIFCSYVSTGSPTTRNSIVQGAFKIHLWFNFVWTIQNHNFFSCLSQLSFATAFLKFQEVLTQWAESKIPPLPLCIFWIIRLVNNLNFFFKMYLLPKGHLIMYMLYIFSNWCRCFKIPQKWMLREFRLY